MFGVNAVTRSLEKRDTSLVLVDGGAQPPIITKHLVELCMINRVPGAQIQQLSSIGDIVGLRSVTCIAFKPLVSVCASFSLQWNFQGSKYSAQQIPLFDL